MPQVVLSRVAGFCFGVQRAVDIALRERRTTTGPMTTLGPIVHNRAVTDRLFAEGVETAADIGMVQKGALILSAHGVAPETRARAKQQGLRVVDVTCPFVTRVHKSARQLIEQGYELVILGDADHSEVKGILGAVEGNAVVVNHPEELNERRFGRRVGIVCQTTRKREEFAKAVSILAAKCFDVRSINTICGATDDLQSAAVDLARRCKVVIVVGGRQSANTAQLRIICEEHGASAYHIESVSELQSNWWDNVDSVGVTAGASTPDWLIEEVAQAINGGKLPSGFTVRHPEEEAMAKFFGETDNVGGRQLAERTMPMD